MRVDREALAPELVPLGDDAGFTFDAARDDAFWRAVADSGALETRHRIRGSRHYTNYIHTQRLLSLPEFRNTVRVHIAGLFDRLEQANERIEAIIFPLHAATGTSSILAQLCVDIASPRSLVLAPVMNDSNGAYRDIWTGEGRSIELPSPLA